MPLLDILLFPDPRLKLVAETVTKFDESLKVIAENMFETMYKADGVGLAAIQVNVQQSLIVMDTSPAQNQPLAIINPIITAQTGEVISEEGCLSFPHVFAKVKRAEFVTVEYQNLEGKKQTIEAEGLTAICLQHEIDHLQGITFYDHLSSLKQQILKRKLSKYLRASK